MSSDIERPFDPASVKSVDLRAGPVYVDIGFLEGDRHRAAFAAIFVALLHANASTLGGLKVSNVRSKRPLGDNVCKSLTPEETLPCRDAGAAEALANALYDNGSSEVVLELHGESVPMELTIHFDNPEFQLKPLRQNTRR